MGSQLKRVKAHDRQLMALKLRKAGITYEDIAAQLGYKSAVGAYHAVTAALRVTLQEPADEVRKLELERLDAMLLAIWQRVTKGDYGAIDRALRVIERRAKLLGLDAPVKQDITSNGQPLKPITIIEVVKDYGNGDNPEAGGDS